MSAKLVRLTDAQIDAILDAINSEFQELGNQEMGIAGVSVATKRAVLSRAQDALMEARYRRGSKR